MNNNYKFRKLSRHGNVPSQLKLNACRFSLRNFFTHPVQLYISLINPTIPSVRVLHITAHLNLSLEGYKYTNVQVYKYAGIQYTHRYTDEHCTGIQYIQVLKIYRYTTISEYIDNLLIKRINNFF